MAGLFSDLRKTAIGACALLFVAVLFAEPGGMGGHVVGHDGAAESNAARAGVPSPPKASPSQSRTAWFAAADAEPEPQITPAPVNNPPVAAPAGAEPALQPVGPDFPPGLSPPH